MNAEQYSASLDVDDLHYEARALAHALFCMFACYPNGDTLQEEQFEAGKHIAWQLVRHTSRLCHEFEASAKRGQR